MSLDLPSDFYVLTRERKLGGQELLEAENIVDMEAIYSLLAPTGNA